MSDSLHKLIIKATESTPAINFDNETGMFEISGKSIPEDSADFFMPVISWLREYALSPCQETVLNITFLYIKSGSFKIMFDIFKIMEDINAAGNPVSINWYFEEDDEEIKEMGNDYNAVINIPFTMIEIKD